MDGTKGVFALGVDPGMHFTGLALVTTQEILAVKLVKVPKAVTGPSAVVAMARQLRDAIREMLMDANYPEWKCDCRELDHEHWPRKPSVYVLESQQVYKRSDKYATGTPEQLLQLAQVAGAALLACLDWDPGPADKGGVYMPLPQEWKGSVPKGISTQHVMRRFGLDWEKYSKIPGAAQLAQGQAEHVLDAAGLGHWGLARFAADQTAREILTKRSGP